MPTRQCTALWLGALFVLWPLASGATPPVPGAPSAPLAPPGIATSPTGLAELIDMAEALNPDTRGAWDEARAAAAATGVARSAYLPQLALEAVAGAERTPLAAPQDVVPRGYFISDLREAVPAMTARWLLFDFGRRKAAVDEANALTLNANATFNRVHQTLAFTISHDYYVLGAAKGKLSAARENMDTTTVDDDAVAARRRQGLATSVEQARSTRSVAQARFTLVRAQGAVNVAVATLVADIGLPAGTLLTVDDADGRQLPLPTQATVRALVDASMEARPDLHAARARIEAADAVVRSAQAAFRPSVTLSAQAFFNDSRLRSDGGPWSSVRRPGGALMLEFSWALFDGGARQSTLAAAIAKRDAAQESYRHAQNQAAKEVATAYSELDTALASASAAREVTVAATLAHDAALASFRHGLATFDDLALEANALSAARADEEDARAGALSAAAALVLATGRR